MVNKKYTEKRKEKLAFYGTNFPLFKFDSIVK
jgi:hypothetical protein